MPMPVPTLPAGDANIPAIGLGTSNLGGDGSVRGEIVATALKLGYRHIDTAWKYGSERDVGEGIRASGVPRGDIFLCTKVSHEYLRAADFARSVDESLDNLGVDYVDLLLVHWPNAAIPLEGDHGRARQGQARRPGAPHRRGEFQHRAARRGDRALPGAAGQPAGRGPSLYRHRPRSSTPAARAASSSPPIARSGAVGCSTIRCWARSPRARAARSRRWRCAGSSSAATSSPIPRSSNPGRWPRTSTCSTSRCRDDEMARIGALKRANGRIANPPGRAPKWD